MSYFTFLFFNCVSEIQCVSVFGQATFWELGATCGRPSRNRAQACWGRRHLESGPMNAAWAAGGVLSLVQPPCPHPWDVGVRPTSQEWRGGPSADAQWHLGESSCVVALGRLNRTWIDLISVGEEKKILFLYPLIFSVWGLQIKLTKDRFTGEKA